MHKHCLVVLVLLSWVILVQSFWHQDHDPEPGDEYENDDDDTVRRERYSIFFLVLICCIYIHFIL